MKQNFVSSPFVERIWAALRQSGYEVTPEESGYMAGIAPQGKAPVCLMDGDGHFFVYRSSDMSDVERLAHMNAIKLLFHTVLTNTMNPFWQKRLIDCGIEPDGSFLDDEAISLLQCCFRPVRAGAEQPDERPDGEDSEEQNAFSELDSLMEESPMLRGMMDGILSGAKTSGIVLSVGEICVFRRAAEDKEAAQEKPEAPTEETPTGENAAENSPTEEASAEEKPVENDAAEPERMAE